MEPRRRTLLGLGFASLTALFGFFFSSQLPAEVVIQFGAGGQPTDSVARSVALVLVPALQILLLGVFTVIPYIDPLGENIRGFQQAYDTFVLLVVGFLGYVHALIILWNAGYGIVLIRALVPAVAVLYYVTGVVMERADQNWFVGIRTPWTLSNEQVWDDTHAIGGILMKAAAVTTLGGLIFPAHAITLIAGSAALVAAITTVYSYWEYRHVSRQET